MLPTTTLLFVRVVCRLFGEFTCSRFLFVGAMACVVVASSLSSVVAEAQSDNPLVAIAREQRIRDEAWAKVESARLNLVNQAMEHALEDKSRARAERQQIQLEINSIKHKRAARDWALQYLAIQEKQARDIQQSFSQTMTRWARVRELYKSRFIAFPEKSAGAVRSGRALNFFLDLCGSTALNLSMNIQEMDEKTRLLDLDIAQALSDVKKDSRVPTDMTNRISPSDPSATLLTELRQNPDIPMSIRENFGELHAQRQLLAQKREILISIGNGAPLAREHLNHLRFTRGQLGSKITLSLAEKPMALQWPYLLESEPEYLPYLRAIGTARKNALRNLSADKRVAPATAKVLAESVDTLYQAFRQDRPRLYRLGRGPDFNNSVWRTSSFLKTLRSSVAYLISANDIGDVTLTKADGVDNANALLAYMMEHGLRFGPAQKIDESAYQYTYRLLIDFYTSVGSLSMVVGHEPREFKADLERLHEREKELIEIETKDTMDTFAMAIESIGELELPYKLSRTSEDTETALQLVNSSLSSLTAGMGAGGEVPD